MFRRHIKCSSREEAKAALEHFTKEIETAKLAPVQRELLLEQVSTSLMQFIEQLSPEYSRRIVVQRRFDGDGYSVRVTADNRPSAFQRLRAAFRGK